MSRYPSLQAHLVSATQEGRKKELEQADIPAALRMRVESALTGRDAEQDLIRDAEDKGTIIDRTTRLTDDPTRIPDGVGPARPGRRPEHHVVEYAGGRLTRGPLPRRTCPVGQHRRCECQTQHGDEERAARSPLHPFAIAIIQGARSRVIICSIQPYIGYVPSLTAHTRRALRATLEQKAERN